MKVPFNDLKRIHDPLKNRFHEILDQVLDKCSFVGDVNFAEEFSKYTGSIYGVSCNSGTDALYIAIKSLELKPNSKIAVPAISYAATAMAVVNSGHIPVFIDVDKETGLMLVESVKNVDCVIPVHLYGQCVNVSKLLDLNIPIIEDCAQAHGATINGKHVGTIGTIGCFSMYPGKNLGALGDAGICITDNEMLSVKMKQYASLGAQKDNRYNHITDGINSRMDGIQGLFLKEKLKHLDEWTNDRIRIGEIYNSSSNAVKRSTIGRDVYHVYYTLQDDRDDYIKYMNENGVQTGIHYPISLPELECFKEYTGNTICINAKEFCKKCVSLPLFPYMTMDEINFTLKCHIDYLLRDF
jgi:dTDP-4-amino-4,6-dideoxygalactose transaminase